MSALSSLSLTRVLHPDHGPCSHQTLALEQPILTRQMLVTTLPFPDAPESWVHHASTHATHAVWELSECGIETLWGLAGTRSARLLL